MSLGVNKKKLLIVVCCSGTFFKALRNQNKRKETIPMGQSLTRVPIGNLGGCWLTGLRDERTPPDTFRRYLANLTFLLVSAALADAPIKNVWVNTPVARNVPGTRLAKPVHVAAILRASLVMADVVQQMIPNIPVWHLDIHREEATAKPILGYIHLPEDCSGKLWLVPDPMLATGGSAILAINLLLERGANISDIRFVCVIAAPEGVDAVKTAFRGQMRIFTATVDEKLDSRFYVIKGLGDAGDREFGTATQTPITVGNKRIAVFKSES